MQGCAFRRFHWFISPFCRLNLKKPILGVWIGNFKPKQRLFNDPLTGTTQVSQKGKTNLTRQWVAVALTGPYANLHLTQTDNHTSTPPLSFYRPDAFPGAQPTAMQNVQIGVVWGGLRVTRSLVMSPFDRAHMTHYLTLIKAMRLFCTILEL